MKVCVYLAISIYEVVQYNGDEGNMIEDGCINSSLWGEILRMNRLFHLHSDVLGNCIEDSFLLQLIGG